MYISSFSEEPRSNHTYTLRSFISVYTFSNLIAKKTLKLLIFSINSIPVVITSVICCKADPISSMLWRVSLRFDLANGYDNVWSFRSFCSKSGTISLFSGSDLDSQETQLTALIFFMTLQFLHSVLFGRHSSNKKPSSHPQILSTSRSPAARRTRHRIRSFAVDEVLLPLCSFPPFEILLL